MIKDASLTEGVAQCTTEVNSRSKMADRTDYLQAFFVIADICFYPKNKHDLLMIDIVAFSVLSFQPVEDDMPTDVVTVHTSGQGKPAIFSAPAGNQLSGLRTNLFLVKMHLKVQN